MESLSATLKGNSTYFLQILQPVLVHLPYEILDLVQSGWINFQSESHFMKTGLKWIKIPFFFSFLFPILFIWKLVALKYIRSLFCAILVF